MQKVLFTRNRLNLSGLLFGPARSRVPVMVMCHGFTGAKEGHGRALKFARLIERLGIAVLLFDFAGSGESDGDFTGQTLSSQVEDLSSAVDFCLGLGLGPVYTMGRSFGGTTVICHAAHDSRVLGCCTWAAPLRVLDLFIGFAGNQVVEDSCDCIALQGKDGIVLKKRAFFDDLALHDVKACASRIAPRPLLLVHGSSDEVVPAGEALDLYRAAGEPRSVSIIDGADHQFTNHYKKAWGISLDWIREVTGIS